MTEQLSRQDIDDLKDLIYAGLLKPRLVIPVACDPKDMANFSLREFAQAVNAIRTSMLQPPMAFWIEGDTIIGDCARWARRREKYFNRGLRSGLCAMNLWMLRARLARKNFGPQQLRGKSASQLLHLLYGDD